MAVFTIPKPEPTSVPSSNRHLPISKTTSFAPGTLIPILCKDILPGDKVKINIDSLIESLPMVAPNLNGYKASFDFYFCPWSNYYGFMDNNQKLDQVYYSTGSRWIFDIGNNVDVRTISDAVDAINNKSVKPGSILDYLGYPPGMIGKQNRTYTPGETTFTPIEVPAEKLLSVLDIYRSYYLNDQEGFAYFVGGTNREDKLVKISNSVLDKITLTLRAIDVNENEYALDVLDSVPIGESDTNLGDAYTTLGAVLRYIIGSSYTNPLGGLPLRTYRMDLNRGVIKSTEGQYVSKVSVANNEFSIDTLRLANKMQKFLDRIDVSGGRFSDMMRMRWGVTPRNTLNVPDYLGSISNFFGVTDVISTASGMNSDIENGRGNSVLGQQAGFAVGKVKRDNAPISFRSDQYGTLVCMFSLVPIVTYSQGIEREDLKTTFADVFDPAFNQLGYQDVDPIELCALPLFARGVRGDNTVNDPIEAPDDISDASVGRRFAWSEYMSSLPRAHGLFAYGQDFDYWVNNRYYQTPLVFYGLDEEATQIVPVIEPYGNVNFSTYIDPAVQNHLFADTSRTSQNFRLRVNFDIWMRRNVGSRVMPHL